HFRTWVAPSRTEKRNERGRLRIGLPRSLRLKSLPDVNLDAVGFVAIHVQHHIDFAAAGHAAWDPQVELIQARISALRAREERFRLHIAELDRHRCEVAPMPESGPEQDQEDLIAGLSDIWTQIDRLRDESILRGVVLRDRLVTQ